MRNGATGKLDPFGESCDVREVTAAGHVGGDLMVLPPTEITHRQLIEACVLSGIVTAICTAGATLKEVTRAAGWHQLAFRSGPESSGAAGLTLEGGGKLILLHAGDNLRALAQIAGQTFTPVGYEGPHAPLAVAAGAVLVVVDTAARAAEVRAAEAAMGNGRLQQQAVTHGRRYIVAARDLPAGQTLAAGDLRFEAGAVGMDPWQAEGVIGRVLLSEVKAGQPLQRAQLDGPDPEPPPWFTPGKHRDKR
ncbi:MAG: hypothetical protein KF696_02515 [Planctomycetes bacterium]|nr:hypothetical protein [Planctomycetota bacterium]MCW8134876.1 hypothetical protein [Planctomycetota bacterium]